MADFILECMYCGHKWEDHYWGFPTNNVDIQCKICKDTKIKIKEKNSEKVDYYAEKIKINKKNTI